MEYYVQTALWHLSTFFTGPFGWALIALIALAVAGSALARFKKR